MRGSSYCEISCSLVEDDAEKPKKEASDATVTFTMMSLAIKLNGDVRLHLYFDLLLCL